MDEATSPAQAHGQPIPPASTAPQVVSSPLAAMGIAPPAQALTTWGTAQQALALAPTTVGNAQQAPALNRSSLMLCSHCDQAIVPALSALWFTPKVDQGAGGGIYMAYKVTLCQQTHRYNFGKTL
jgi:hypothetical protein